MTINKRARTRRAIATGIDSVMFPATQGYVFTVSPEDAEWVSQYNWHTSSNGHKRKTGKGMPYIVREDYSTGKGKTVFLHSELWKRHNPNTEIPEGCVINHKDVDPTNNLYDNLECIPKWLDQGKQYKQVSGQKPLPIGISMHKQTGKYRVDRQIGNTKKYCGLYDTPEQALEGQCKCYPELCS